MQKAKNLRNSTTFKNVYINPDLTIRQQKESKALRDELKKRRNNGESVVIRNGEVVPKNNEQNFP